MRLPPPGPRRDLALALLLAVAAAALRLPRLGVPPEEIFDEVYHAKSALQYLEGQPPVDWVHPPTSKLLIAVGVAAFGYRSWAWRLAPALAGIALAPVFFLLARRILATERAALFAAALLLTDGVYLVQSRVAMTNIFAVLFQVATALFLLRAALEDRLPVGGMLAAGLCLGLAVSTRWTSFFAVAFLGLVFLVLRGRRLVSLREVALTLAVFLVLPLGVYALSYVPLLLQGNAFGQLVDSQWHIWNYHATLQAEHPYFSHWYTWPWLYRPTLYYFNTASPEGTVRGILALGNPALWWAAIPATVWALVTGVRKNDPRRIFAGAGFCFLYLPWGASPRTLNFSHYLFEAIPYACLSLGMLLDRAWEGGPWRAGLARGYGLAAVLLFLFFYPYLAAVPIPAEIFYQQLWQGTRPWWWFPTWI